MRSGSATISRTVIRGLSDAYGSWKTIWMSRRTGRICFRLNFVMSVPLKMMSPLVGSTSLMIVRPSVVFPQPDSPTTPSVSPRMTVRSTPSTARTWPTVFLKHPGLDRELLDEMLDPEDLVRIPPSAMPPRPSAAGASVTTMRSSSGRLTGVSGRAPRRSGRRRCGPRRARTVAAQGSPSGSALGPASGRSADETRSRAAA